MSRPKAVHLALHELFETTAVACGADKHVRNGLLTRDELPAAVSCRHCRRTNAFRMRFVIYETAQP
jgi:hypothetical protein